MLTINHLSKNYPNGTAALKNFTLQINDGEAVAIVGGSGSGKSTLLRLIAGLETPTTGSVHINGELITEPHSAIGFVFQEPRLLPWLKVAENVAFGLSNISAAERKERVHRALQSVGLAAHADKWPRELSGGMAQRVALARALVSKPSALLLDEPFSALDALTRAGLQDHLVSLWEEANTTLILVTHDIEEALVIADRIIVLRPNPGRIDDIISVSLPRPRDRDASAFEEIKHTLRSALDHSITRPEAALA
jgi:sulfonate transport system ATP-binding protein